MSRTLRTREQGEALMSCRCGAVQPCPLGRLGFHFRGGGSIEPSGRTPPSPKKGSIDRTPKILPRATPWLMVPVNCAHFPNPPPPPRSENPTSPAVRSRALVRRCTDTRRGRAFRGKQVDAQADTQVDIRSSKQAHTSTDTGTGRQARRQEAAGGTWAAGMTSAGGLSIGGGVDRAPG